MEIGTRGCAINYADLLDGPMALTYCGRQPLTDDAGREMNTSPPTCKACEAKVNQTMSELLGVPTPTTEGQLREAATELLEGFGDKVDL